MVDIKLGDEVRCIYTGFKGIAIYKTEFINGCIQYGVAPKWDKKDSLREEMGIDSQSLEVIKPKKKKVVKKETGGAMTRGLKRRNF